MSRRLFATPPAFLSETAGTFSRAGRVVIGCANVLTLAAVCPENAHSVTELEIAACAEPAIKLKSLSVDPLNAAVEGRGSLLPIAAHGQPQQPSKLPEAPSNTLQMESLAGDKKAYREVLLSNKLQILLISNPDADNCKIGVAIGAGKLHSPESCPFTADILREHLKQQISTKERPWHAADNRFEFTTYCVTAKPEGLEKSLKDTLQILSKPVLTDEILKKTCDKYLQSLTLGDLPYSATDIMTKLANPKHPVGRQSRQELKKRLLKQDKTELMKATLEYHEKYYSANVMKLCVMGRESLDDLEKIVRKAGFESIKNNNVVVPKGEEIGGSEVLFLPENLKKMVKQSERRRPMVAFRWILPSQISRWESKPVSFISDLFRHSGKGSLQSVLNEERLNSWIVSSRVVPDVAGKSVLKLFVYPLEKTMTPESIDRIGQLVHQYIQFLQNSPIEDWRVEEFKVSRNSKYRHHPFGPSGYLSAERTALSMLHYPIEKVLSAEEAVWKPNAEEIKEMLKHLVPENMVVTLTGQQFQEEATANLWNKDEESDSYYRVEPLSQETIDSWTGKGKQPMKVANFTLPKPNLFLTTDFSIKPLPLPKEQMPTVPQLVSNLNCPRLPNSRLFFFQDPECNSPAAFVRLRCSTTVPCTKAKNVAFTKILQMICHNKNKEMTRDAAAANVFCYGSLETAKLWNVNLELQISGPSSALPAVLEKLCQSRGQQEITREEFEEAKEEKLKLIDHHDSYKYSRELFNDVSKAFMVEPNINGDDYYAAMKQVTFEDFMKLYNNLFEGMAVDAVIQGNVVESEALEWMKIVEKSFGVDKPVDTSAARKPAREFDLRKMGETPIRIRTKIPASESKVDHNQVYLTIQTTSNSDVEKSALLQIAMKYLHPAIIRNNQQVNPWLYSSSYSHIDCVRLEASSKTLTPEEITRRFEANLEEYLLNAEKHITEDKFQEMKEKALSTTKRMSRARKFYIKPSDSKNIDFAREEKKLKCLESVTYPQFLKYLKESLFNAPWVAVEVEAEKPEGKAATTNPAAETSTEFKLTAPTTPVAWKNFTLNEWKNTKKEYFPSPDEMKKGNQRS